MPDDSQTLNEMENSHRGRVQAQGGGTEKSESWAQNKPPTVRNVLGKVDRLEGQLTPKERLDREQPLLAMRTYLTNAGNKGGIWAIPKAFKKSFLKRGSDDIRVDLEVHKGAACVPEPPGDN